MFKLMSVSLLSIAAFCFMSSTAPARASASAAATLHGTVTGVNGQPAAGVEVKLFKAEKHPRHEKPAATDGADVTPAHPHHRPAALQSTTTKSDGTFSFATVELGKYFVVAGAKGQGRGHAKVDVKDDQAQTINITLAMHDKAHKPVSTK